MIMNVGRDQRRHDASPMRVVEGARDGGILGYDYCIVSVIAK